MSKEASTADIAWAGLGLAMVVGIGFCSGGAFEAWRSASKPASVVNTATVYDQDGGKHTMHTMQVEGGRLYWGDTGGIAFVPSAR